jgi:hypothetical protein
MTHRTGSLKPSKEFATRGNHKSAKTYDMELRKKIEKELRQGWMFPLPKIYLNLKSWGACSSRDG